MQYYNGTGAIVIHPFTSFSLAFWEVKAHVFVLGAHVWVTNAFQACRFSLNSTTAEVFKYIKHSQISWEKVASG